MSGAHEMPADLTLVSHPLCPYVQRAAIALAEKHVPFRRVDIDLSAKPDWFLALSPLGKTPVLKVGQTPIFESAVILEYLDDTVAPPLHPADPLQRARHRGWIELSSAVLNDIAAFYSAVDAAAFETAARKLRARFVRIEADLGAGPWFAGLRLTLVDAAFAPVFRYFDMFDRLGDFGVLSDLSKTAQWRAALGARPSVRQAVTPDYAERLSVFVRGRKSHLGQLARNATALSP